jgi:hypothetical protein
MMIVVSSEIDLQATLAQSIVFKEAPEQVTANTSAAFWFSVVASDGSNPCVDHCAIQCQVSLSLSLSLSLTHTHTHTQTYRQTGIYVGVIWLASHVLQLLSIRLASSSLSSYCVAFICKNASANIRLEIEPALIKLWLLEVHIC